jgi:transposase
VKRGKNDAVDAEAICEAVTRPTMRFVPIKSREQQAALSLHRVRSLLIGQRTQLVNLMRSQLGEFGIAIPAGLGHALVRARQLVDGETAFDLPVPAAEVIVLLARQALELHARLRELDLRLDALQRSDEMARRLATIPGIGPVSATALVAAVADPHQFRSGRQFAAWLGLTPRQKSSGGKERLGRITKMGDKYLRQLLVIGATSMIRRAKDRPDAVDPRLVALLARKPAKLARK